MLYLSDCFVGLVSGGESDKRVATVHAGHGVHHQTEVPDLAALLEQRDQVVLVDVARNLATEDLTKNINPFNDYSHEADSQPVKTGTRQMCQNTLL